MKKISVLVLVLALSFTLSGCSMFGKSKPGAGSGPLAEEDLDAQRQARFGEGSIPLAESEGVLRDVSFDYDSAAIDDTARQNIEYNLDILKANPDVRVQLEGHCDERGTVEYNMALGQRRARAVEEILLSSGISQSKLSSISYGEEVPLDSSHTEAAWRVNRRVHFSAFRDLPRG